MIEVLLYTLIDFLIFYIVYTNVFGTVFTKTKWLYFVTIGGTCLLQCGVFLATAKIHISAAKTASFGVSLV